MFFPQLQVCMQVWKTAKQQMQNDNLRLFGIVSIIAMVYLVSVFWGIDFSINPNEQVNRWDHILKTSFGASEL